MKKINILIVLGLFVLLIGVVQPVQALKLGGNLKGKYEDYLFNPQAAHLNAAASKFEGLLNAYSANRVRDEYMPWADDYWPPSGHLLSAASDLSSSLEQFNLALMEVYPILSEEEQLAVREAYSSLGLYLADLAVRTNSVFDKEVLIIEQKESDKEPLWLWSVNAWTLPDNA